MPPKKKAIKKAEKSKNRLSGKTITKILKSVTISNIQKTDSKSKKVSYLASLNDSNSPKEGKWINQSDLSEYEGASEQIKMFKVEKERGKEEEGSEKEIPTTEMQKKKENLSSVLQKVDVDKTAVISKLQSTKTSQSSLDNFVSKKEDKPGQKGQKMSTTSPRPKEDSTAMSQKQRAQGSMKKDSVGSKKSPINYLQKVQKIKKIKSFQRRNDEWVYECDAWDQNGQTIFVPPLSSKVVKKLDHLKVCLFLHECLLRGCEEKAV